MTDILRREVLIGVAASAAAAVLPSATLPEVNEIVAVVERAPEPVELVYRYIATLKPSGEWVLSYLDDPKV